MPEHSAKPWMNVSLSAPDPAYGRLFESFGEDPLLTGEMAAQYIQSSKQPIAHEHALV